MPDEDKMNAELTVEQKIANIRNCTDYRQMAWDWFPPAHADEYYFVSYSHRDYKEVFEDIYALEGQGLHIWYDRELRPGKDWEIEARAHIYDFKCKGVIFYIGQNSVASESIHREIEFVKRSGKSYLSINLPVNGEYLSAAEILRRVRPVVKDDEKHKTLEETFNDKVTYLKLSEEPFARAQRIKSALVSLPLLKFKIEEKNDGNKPATVIGINDINATVVKEEDFICQNDSGEIVPVTKIGVSAFANCSFLEEIELPNTLKSLETYAFYNCSSLKHIVIPNGVEAVGDNSFAGCDKLENIIIPNSVADITWLHCCTALKKITIPNGITKIAGNTFSGCASLESITLPDSVTKIGWHAFEFCTSLESITIPKSVTQIDDAAFFVCTSLKNITIPKSVTVIGEWAFEGCISLESITIPNGVTQIGAQAFSGCSSLKNIEVCAGNTAYAGQDGILYNKDKTRIICVPCGKSAVTIPGSVTEIGWKAFEDCALLTSITIPNSVTQIGIYAFEGCTSLVNIAIPNSVTQIGIHAFEGCTSLESIAIPNSVSEIGEYTFKDCTSLESIAIPNSVTQIGIYAFEGCTSLENIEVVADNPVYASQNGILYNKTKTKIICVPCGKNAAIIPDGVTQIGDAAFFGCTALESITIPNGVTQIGDYAFEGCALLISIIIPDSVTKIGKNVFEGCALLKKITIPKSITKIGDSAFERCPSLESIEVSEDNPNYESYDGTLYTRGRTKIIYVPCGKRTVTIPNGVTQITGFEGCASLTSITVSQNATQIGYRAFEGCISLKNITIPDSVFTIGMRAFSGCTSLESINIPCRVNKIGELAFHGCTSLKKIKYDGTVGQWIEIEKDEDWDYNTPDYAVYCTDGEIHKDGTEIKY